jgi:hypothetical protein
MDCAMKGRGDTVKKGNYIFKGGNELTCKTIKLWGLSPKIATVGFSAKFIERFRA